MDSKLREKNICITGGSGFVGSHLTDHLISLGMKNIIVVDNFFLGNEINLAQAKINNKNLQIIRADAADFASMQNILQKFSVDLVFNLAVIPLPTSLEYPAWTIEKNIAIVSNLCELLRKRNYTKLIHCSSSEAYGTAAYAPMDESHPLNATTPYASSKAAGDLILKTYINTFDLKATIVRPFNTFGPRQNSGSYAGIIPIILQKIKNKTPIEIHGDGLQTRDFTFVYRTVEYIVKASESPSLEGKIINIASGVETSIIELIRQILSIKNMEDYPIIFTDKRAGDVQRHIASINLAKEHLGMTEAKIQRQELEETIKWYEK